MHDARLSPWVHTRLALIYVSYYLTTKINLLDTIFVSRNSEVFNSMNQINIWPHTVCLNYEKLFDDDPNMSTNRRKLDTDWDALSRFTYLARCTCHNYLSFTRYITNDFELDRTGCPLAITTRLHEIHLWPISFSN